MPNIVYDSVREQISHYSGILIFIGKHATDSPFLKPSITATTVLACLVYGIGLFPSGSPKKIHFLARLTLKINFPRFFVKSALLYQTQEFTLQKTESSVPPLWKSEISNGCYY